MVIVFISIMKNLIYKLMLYNLQYVNYRSLIIYFYKKM